VDRPNETTHTRQSEQPEEVPANHFVTTHWSVVLSAREKNSARAAKALETLCRTYWYPLNADTRRRGHRPPDAEDLTQEFFARLLQKDYLQSVAQEKGKFRTFLLLAGVTFVCRDGTRASRLRVLWRTLVAWCPMLLMLVLFELLKASLGMFNAALGASLVAFCPRFSPWFCRSAAWPTAWLARGRYRAKLKLIYEKHPHHCPNRHHHRVGRRWLLPMAEACHTEKADQFFAPPVGTKGAGDCRIPGFPKA
jgi:hypothetical protein